MTQTTLFDDPPRQAHSPTSIEAAEAIKPDSNRLRAVVLAWIRSRGELGSTDEEGIAGTGMNPSTYRPRRIELWRAGVIREGGERLTASGRKAVVWVGVGG